MQLFFRIAFSIFAWVQREPRSANIKRTTAVAFILESGTLFLLAVLKQEG